jgi:hypothetical protein
MLQPELWHGLLVRINVTRLRGECKEIFMYKTGEAIRTES